MSASGENEHDYRPSELSGLISRMCDGEITPDEHARLTAMLRESALARRQYCEFFKLHGELTWSFGQQASQPSDSGAPKTPASPVLGFLGGVVDYVSHSRTLMFWMICTGLFTFFAAHFGSVLLGRFWAQNAQVAKLDGAAKDVRPADRDANHSEIPVGAMVARLTNAIDCEWQRPAGAVGSNRLGPFMPGRARRWFSGRAKVGTGGRFGGTYL